MLHTAKKQNTVSFQVTISKSQISNHNAQLNGQKTNTNI